MSKKASSKEESTTLKNPDTLPSSIDKNTQQEKENRKFIILRSLGQGSFGKVKEALHVLTQEKLAIKILEFAFLVQPAREFRPGGFPGEFPIGGYAFLACRHSKLNAKS